MGNARLTRRQPKTQVPNTGTRGTLRLSKLSLDVTHWYPLRIRYVNHF